MKLVMVGISSVHGIKGEVACMNPKKSPRLVG